MNTEGMKENNCQVKIVELPVEGVKSICVLIFFDAPLGAKKFLGSNFANFPKFANFLDGNIAKKKLCEALH